MAVLESGFREQFPFTQVQLLALPIINSISEKLGFVFSVQKSHSKERPACLHNFLTVSMWQARKN